MSAPSAGRTASRPRACCPPCCAAGPAGAGTQGLRGAGRRRRPPAGHGGRPDRQGLGDVYKSLGAKIGVRHVKRDVSSGFAGAGAVLLLAALSTGLRRRSRLA
jgi:hypothetical protein